MEKYNPHPYQKEAIKLMLSQGCAGLLLDPGLGKTSISLCTSKILKNKNIVNGTLVISPLRPAKNTWPAEVKKWEEFKDIDMVVLHGKGKDKLLKEKHDVYVINPEGLEWLFQPTWTKKKCTVSAARMQVLMQKFDMVIIDESTKFKSPTSQRFNIIKATLDWWKRRYILTGTPAPNGIMDLWAQIYILDGGAALSPFITHFRNTYFYLKPNSHEWDYVMFPGSEEKIATKINHLVLRMKAEDYLQMPELVYQRIDVDLSPKVMAQYKELKKEFMLLVEEGVVTAANSAVLSGKLRQVVSGCLYLPEGKAELHDEKVQALADLVEELSGQPLLVATDFVFERGMIEKVLPNARFLDGKHDAELIKYFNAGMIPVLVGNPASVGHGLNLQSACAHVAFLSLTWNLENFDQFIRRVLRQGNTSMRVLVHLIMAKGTIDEAVWETLQEKDLTQNNLLSKLKRLAS